MIATKAIAALAATILGLSPVLEAKEPVAYPDGNGIIVHSLDSFGVMFSNLCLDHAGDAAGQKAEMEVSAWDFQPMENRNNRWHWESVVLSISEPSNPGHCGLTGMVSGPDKLETAATRFAEITGVGQAAFQKRQVGEDMMDMAFWSVGETHSVQLVLVPQIVLHADGAVDTGPSHITILLSSNQKEAE